MKKVAGAIGGILLVGIAVAWQVFGGSAEVALENAAGTGWDDARADMLTEISAVINEEYELFGMENSVLDAISECIVDDSIKFLNASDCSYLYNPSLTSEAEHLATQESCMVAVKFEDKQAGYTLKCSKAHFPEDWKLMHGILLSEFESSFVEEGVETPAAKTISLCISDKLVAMMNTKKFPLINKKARNPEDLLFPLDNYIEEEEVNKEFMEIVEGCSPQTEEEETE